MSVNRSALPVAVAVVVTVAAVVAGVGPIGAVVGQSAEAVTVSVGDVTAVEGGSTTTTVRLDTAPDGLGSYRLTVESNDSDVGAITDVSGIGRERVINESATNVTVEGYLSDPLYAEDVRLLEVTLAGDAPGTAAVNVTVHSVGATTLGDTYDTTTRNGTVDVYEPTTDGTGEVVESGTNRTVRPGTAQLAVPIEVRNLPGTPNGRDTVAVRLPALGGDASPTVAEVHAVELTTGEGSPDPLSVRVDEDRRTVRFEVPESGQPRGYYTLEGTVVLEVAATPAVGSGDRYGTVTVRSNGGPAVPVADLRVDGPPVPTVAVENVTSPPANVTTATVSADRLPYGVDFYELTVGVNDTAVGSILDVRNARDGVELRYDERSPGRYTVSAPVFEDTTTRGVDLVTVTMATNGTGEASLNVSVGGIDYASASRPGPYTRTRTRAGTLRVPARNGDGTGTVVRKVTNVTAVGPVDDVTVRARSESLPGRANGRDSVELTFPDLGSRARVAAVETVSVTVNGTSVPANNVSLDAAGRRVGVDVPADVQPAGNYSLRVAATVSTTVDASMGASAGTGPVVASVNGGPDVPVAYLGVRGAREPTVSVENVTTVRDGVVEADVELDSAPRGLYKYDLLVGVYDDDVARVVGAASNESLVERSSDSHPTQRVALLAGTVDTDEPLRNLTLGTVTLQGVDTGSTLLEPSVEKLSYTGDGFDPAELAYNRTTATGTVTVGRQNDDGTGAVVPDTADVTVAPPRSVETVPYGTTVAVPFTVEALPGRANGRDSFELRMPAFDRGGYLSADAVEGVDVTLDGTPTEAEATNVSLSLNDRVVTFDVPASVQPAGNYTLSGTVRLAVEAFTRVGGSDATGPVTLASNGGTRTQVGTVVLASPAPPGVAVGDATLVPGEADTVPVRVDSLPYGVSRVALSVTVEDSAVAELTGIEVPDELRAGPVDRVNASRTNYTVRAPVSVAPGAEAVRLATADVTGRTPGSAALSVDVRALQYGDSGEDVYDRTAVHPGAVAVSQPRSGVVRPRRRAMTARAPADTVSVPARATAVPGPVNGRDTLTLRLPTWNGTRVTVEDVESVTLATDESNRTFGASNVRVGPDGRTVSFAVPADREPLEGTYSLAGTANLTLAVDATDHDVSGPVTLSVNDAGGGAVPTVPATVTATPDGTGVRSTHTVSAVVGSPAGGANLSSVAVAYRGTDAHVGGVTASDVVRFGVDTDLDGLIERPGASVASVTTTDGGRRLVVNASGPQLAVGDVVIVEYRNVTNPTTAGSRNVTVGVNGRDATRTVLDVGVDGRQVATLTAGPNRTAEVPPLTGADGRATDPDGDGRYEDVDGDGTAAYDDVVTLFRSVTAEPVQSNTVGFDFNGNGRADFADVIALFDEVS